MKAVKAQPLHIYIYIYIYNPMDQLRLCSYISFPTKFQTLKMGYKIACNKLLSTPPTLQTSQRNTCARQLHGAYPHVQWACPGRLHMPDVSVWLIWIFASLRRRSTCKLICIGKHSKASISRDTYGHPSQMHGAVWWEQISRITLYMYCTEWFCTNKLR